MGILSNRIIDFKDCEVLAKIEFYVIKITKMATHVFPCIALHENSIP